jgi:hypothetical protein
MASKNPLKRIYAALSALDTANGTIGRLDAVRRLREAAEELEAAQVEAARKAGVTWIEIGACYGLTKQGAQQRFRAVRNQAKTSTPAPTPAPAPAPAEGSKRPSRSSAAVRDRASKDALVSDDATVSC